MCYDPCPVWGCQHTCTCGGGSIPHGWSQRERGPGNQVELGQCTQAARRGSWGFLSLAAQDPRLSANFSTDQLQGQATDGPSVARFPQLPAGGDNYSVGQE